MIFRFITLVALLATLAACGTATPAETTATAGGRVTSTPAAGETTGATPLSPEEALTASAAEGSAASETTGATPLSPEEALTASAAEGSAIASTPGATQLSPEEALTAAAAESTVAAGTTTGATQLSPEEALTAAAAEATVAAESTTGAAPTVAASSGPLEPITLGLGYIPNVQFAPFYVASSKGYYAAEGLDVDFSYGGNVNDLLLQTATGQLPFVVAAGDEVLLARSQGLPIKMISLVFQQVPVAVFAKTGAGVTQPSDLRGKTIGLPGRYGATYIALRGLLYSQDIQENEVTLTEIGFTQFEAVSQDRVPVAVGYANNEPLRLADSGDDVSVIEVSDYINLVSNGIIASETLLAERPDTARRFIRATLRGLQDTFANPQEAFDLSLQFIPELGADQQPFQRRVLDATIPYWQPVGGDTSAAGTMNPEAWQTTYTFLRDSGIMTQETDPAQAWTDEFLP